MSPTACLAPLRTRILSSLLHSSPRRTSLLSSLPSRPITTTTTLSSLVLPPFPSSSSSSHRSYSSSADEIPYYPRQSPPTKKVKEYTMTLIVLGCVPIFTAWLTWWQIQRLKWKLELIDELEMNLMRAPLSLPDVLTQEDLALLNWRKVTLKGYFLPLDSPILPVPVRIGPRITDGENGYHLVLPFFRTPSADAKPNDPPPRPILINLGFIKKDIADQGTSHIKIPQGEVELEGMLRTAGQGELSQKKAGKKPTSFTPDNDPEKGEWFWMDAGGFALYYSTKELGDVMPLICDLTYDGDIPKTMLSAQGIPVGRPPKIELRNQHAIYAITWFSLSVITAGLWVLVWKKGKRVKPMQGRMGR